MRFQLSLLDPLDVRLDLFRDQLLVRMIEGEVERDSRVGPLHAVDVRVDDLAGDVEGQGQFGFQWSSSRLLS